MFCFSIDFSFFFIKVDLKNIKKSMAKLVLILLFALAFMVSSSSCRNNFEKSMSFLLDQILRGKNTLEELEVEKLLKAYISLIRIKRILNKIDVLKKKSKNKLVKLTNFFRF